jgi:hypothetical protein
VYIGAYPNVGSISIIGSTEAAHVPVVSRLQAIVIVTSDSEFGARLNGNADEKADGCGTFEHVEA